jgi:SpoVK/Ycf46/Vps4 family AAA+-type ATPase
VESLVKTHSQRPKTASKGKLEKDIKHHVDFIRGKGDGIIMLLHGPPGVWKTSTAECVAELCDRPLFQITCGDIGTDPKDVEKNLNDNFRLADRWGCVLLLDEADVFLTKRGQEDLKRNTLVSGIYASATRPTCTFAYHYYSIPKSSRVLSWDSAPNSKSPAPTSLNQLLLYLTETLTD